MQLLNFRLYLNVCHEQPKSNYNFFMIFGEQLRIVNILLILFNLYTSMTVSSRLVSSEVADYKSNTTFRYISTHTLCSICTGQLPQITWRANNELTLLHLTLLCQHRTQVSLAENVFDVLDVIKNPIELGRRYILCTTQW